MTDFSQSRATWQNDWFQFQQQSGRHLDPNYSFIVCPLYVFIVCLFVLLLLLFFYFIFIYFVYFSVHCTLCIFVFYNHCCLVRINKWMDGWINPEICIRIPHHFWLRFWPQQTFALSEHRLVLLCKYQVFVQFLSVICIISTVGQTEESRQSVLWVNYIRHL